ncbi:MAG: type II toxin-antitoxin system HicB family antitoxin [Nanoarchaeota archaeon]
MVNMKFTVIIEKDKNSYIARCLELDVVSQGRSPGVALDNIKEALELYHEKPSKMLYKQVTVATVEVAR